MHEHAAGISLSPFCHFLPLFIYTSPAYTEYFILPPWQKQSKQRYISHVQVGATIEL